MNAHELASKNPGLLVMELSDPRLAPYARPVDIPGLASLVKQADPLIPWDLEANAYTASSPELEALPEARGFEPLFGFQKLQVGWNAGPNSTLNGVEWHKSTEILVAVTDLALLLGRVEDLEYAEPGAPGPAARFASSKTVCFHMPLGSAIEIKPGTLHLAPCKLVERGFKSLVILPLGTNTPLRDEEKDAAKASASSGEREAALLFLRNKWLLAHPERKALVEKGAVPGVYGENREVRFR